MTWGLCPGWECHLLHLRQYLCSWWGRLVHPPPPTHTHIGAAPASARPVSCPSCRQRGLLPFPQQLAASVWEGKSEGAACPVTGLPLPEPHPRGRLPGSPLCAGIFYEGPVESVERNLQVVSPPLPVALSSALPAHPSSDPRVIGCPAASVHGWVPEKT